MKIIPIENQKKINKAVPKIESQIDVNISVNKEKAVIKGNELNEFIAGEILRAVDFGFDIEDALLLKKGNFILEFINIKEHTRRKKLEDVRARVIGKKGRAIATIEEITGCAMVVRNNEVGLIVDSEHLESATQGVISLARGAKHGNVFTYLEKQNASLKKFNGDFGLKNFKNSETKE